MTTKPYTLHRGDCIEVMRGMADNSVDAVVTDPPYHLTTGKKGGTGPASVNLESPYGRARIGTGFMGMKWDGGDIAQSVELWTEVLRVLKPGGHVLAFSGTRTQHRMVCAIEDAGFEVRDQIGWAFGSGFPKSRNISADMTEGADDWAGWGTALKPAWEPICVARKPLAKGHTVAANVLAHGTGALNIDGCRVATSDALSGGAYAASSIKDAADATSFTMGASAGVFVQPEGRWPANLIHDGSDEVLALFPDSKGQMGRSTDANRSQLNTFGVPSDNGKVYEPRNDTGSAARFFYCAKTSKADRGAENIHPTVKPTDLMAYLCRLVTPPGGVVLDPFMGSGSTGKAAMREGFQFIGIDLSEEYFPIAQARIEHELACVVSAQAAAAVAAAPIPQLALF